MKDQTSRILRVVLLVYAIYSVIYGLLHVISPELVGAKDPAIERVLGAAVLAFALGAWLAYAARSWQLARSMVIVQIVWMALYTVTLAWGILAGGVTPAAWPPTIIGAIFAILLLALYIREEQRQK